MTTKKVVSIGFYAISYPVKHQFQKKTWWMRIGSATELDTGQIMCRVEAMPHDWDGTFRLFPTEVEGDES